MKKITNVYTYWGSCGSISSENEAALRAAKSIIGTSVESDREAEILLEKTLNSVGYRVKFVNVESGRPRIGWNIVLDNMGG